MMRFIFILATLLIVSCAHHKNVIPAKNGVNTISIKAKTSNSGKSEAMVEANHYCNQHAKTVEFISERRSQPIQMKASNQVHAYKMTFTCK
jgi:hypothetical protein